MSTATVTSAPATSPALVASASKAKAAPAIFMEFVATRDELLAEISSAQGIASAKTTIPILSHLLIEANDGAVSVSANNLEQSLRTKFNAIVKKPGTATVPARKLYDYIRLLPAGDVNVKLLDNSWIQIRAGRSTTKMVGMPRDSYPQVTSPDNLKSVSLSTQLLRSLIGRTIVAVSTEESRYTLNAALLILEANKVSMVSTDGHRLAIASKDDEVFGVDKARKLLIPSKSLHDLNSLLGSSNEDTVQIFEDETSIFFRIGTRNYSTRKMSGQFPNYAAVVPTNNKNTAIVRTADFERSLRRVSQFADEKSNGIKLNLGANTLKISSSSLDSGESEDTLDAPYAGDPIAIKVNAGYVLDFCKVVGGTGEIKMSFKDGQSAARLEPEVSNSEFTSFVYIVMPMR